MSNELAFAVARAQARASLHGTWLDGGSVKLYTAPKPANPGEEVSTQTLLCAFPLPDPAGAAVDGFFIGEIPPPALILQTGTPLWARSFDATGTVIWDADVGETGSGAAVEVDNLNLVQGAYANVTSITIAEL